jgi:hypothetical protein
MAQHPPVFDSDEQLIDSAQTRAFFGDRSPMWLTRRKREREKEIARGGVPFPLGRFIGNREYFTLGELRRYRDSRPHVRVSQSAPRAAVSRHPAARSRPRRCHGRPRAGGGREGGMIGRCQGCGESTALFPLHGEKGGPVRCPLCLGKWHAEHGRRRNRGRIVIRAIKGYLDGGGKWDDVDKLKLAAAGTDLFDLDPLGYMAGTAKTVDEVIELTSELLNQTLVLVHPDMHPPERQELAHHVTNQLLALRPFVFPAIKPEAPVKPKPHPAPAQAPPKRKANSALAYPCADCADAFPCDYCDACKAEWNKRQQQEFEQRTAKQRASYARRRARVVSRRPLKLCASCGKEFKSSETMRNSARRVVGSGRTGGYP